MDKNVEFVFDTEKIKPNTKELFYEFEIPFEIIQVPDFQNQDIQIKDSLDIVKEVFEDKTKIKIMPKNSYIEVNFEEHFI